ncbi:MAG: prolyl oligopeptidase family serine peptidase, partial [Candidatus Amulumruptor sp.]|nr:prolyl oligopeptidase family serine peptidase [Candidatus Amulumruptor sp.]
KPLFVYEPAKHSFTELNSVLDDLVQSYDLPVNGNLVAWRGASASNSERVYVTDTRKGSTRMIDYPSADRLADVALGEVKPFEYVTSRGDTIYARYYLPADFDPTRKYPVIVNYYGGCSPTGRNFESRYPHHLYAAQGYAVLVINPSGCTGRGQEWASRHVNTAGEGVAQDIIEGTQQFCRANEWADSTALGCIGASYGGFMTQYLQTQTPMFAAAISHAGISDHTSYWGEGYWGYSYSEVSMANSYPWTRKDIYVDRSPLYLADKINTPLLFLHGDSDNNVPVGESIQMFTALKILGRPTAFVAVADQDHHILDYDKRIKWQDTIFAWFEKYLKHDSTWWDTLYPPKSL